MVEPVRLNNIEAFRNALAQYQISLRAQRVLDESRLVVLSGLAGGGRNTTINYLVEHANYMFLVSDTTRPPKLRGGVMEQHGVHYYFRTEQDMLHDIQNGNFIEAEIIHNQQVSGTSIRELEKANKAGLIGIHDFEFGGARNIAEAKPDANIIGLLPPSYDEWLRRLQAREEMHDVEFKNRLETAEKVLEQMLGESYFTFVVNDTVERCAEAIRAIVESGKADPERQAASRQVAQELLVQVIQHLKSL
jgi:guanylate kinase